MLPPHLSIGCLADPVTCISPVADLGGGLAKGVAESAAEAIFSAVNLSLSTTADWLAGHVIGLIQATATPELGMGWFTNEADLMEQVVTMVLLPILLVASIGPVLRQDGRRLFRVWAVGLPIAVLAGVVGSQLAGLALSATDEMCRHMAGQNGTQLARQFSASMGQAAQSGAPVFVEMLLSMLTIAGCVLVWLEMMVRGAAIYVATFFMPLVLVGYIWPSTAGMAKRGVEILASLILSKFVIVATLSLGFAAFAWKGSDGVVAGAGLLLLAGFAPFALLRLAPVVEAAAIGHLEGMSRRPVHAATRAARAAVSAPSHPVGQMLLNRTGGGGQPPAAARVGASLIPERQADYATGGSSRGGSADA